MKILRTLEFNKIQHKLSAHASTSLGKELAEEAVPTGDFEQVKQRLQETDEAYAVERLKGGIPFGGIRNITGPLHRARVGGTLNPSELLDIASTISGGRRLKRFIEAVSDEHPLPLLTQRCEAITEHRPLEDAIKECIDDNAAVMDSASLELARIRQELKTNESRVRERLESMIRSSSVQKMLQDVLVTIRSDRYVIPVKQEYRSNFGGIIHDQSASGATLFIEPESVVPLNNRLRELKFKEETEIEKILARLTALVAEHVETLLANVNALAGLDLIAAKARLAHEQKAVLPQLNDQGYMRIIKGRHPLIPQEAVVPLDIELGKGVNTIIVTGPNTGGKTVSLKTVGLLSLMAMTGLFVPAQEGTQLCVYDGIYADIGDEQSIEQNLSTFSSHMTNIISILKEMTPQSLILLDELGAGTDPTEGSALAISILEYIHRMGCRMIATTHYSELKAYAFEREGIINASMEFDVQSLSPTYRLLVGVPGRSNAFAIAERLGLSRSIIEHARGQVTEEDQRVETMIATLEENRLAAEAERRIAEETRREAEALRREFEAEQHRFREQRDKLLEKAERDARDAVAKARREADEVIADLRRMALAGAASIKEHHLIDAKGRLTKAEPQLRGTQPPVKGGRKKAVQLKPGDEVKVASLNQKGSIVDIASDTEVIVQIGIMKMKVNKQDVELISSGEKTKQAVKSSSSLQRTRDDNARMELDLRGYNLEDAYIAVDRFLDESFLANFGQVYLIHGKGTGVLRTGLQEYLRRHGQVQSYRTGNYNEGGTGVTVVELK